MKIFIKPNFYNGGWFWQCAVDGCVVAVQTVDSATIEDCKNEFRLFASRLSASSLETTKNELPDFDFQVIQPKGE